MKLDLSKFNMGRFGAPNLQGHGVRVLLLGETGTGKTEFAMSATEIAHVVIVDTEGRSAFYDENKGHGFSVTYSRDPQDALAGLALAEKMHKAGVSVVFVLDSFSSVWFEQQEVAEKVGKTGGDRAKFQSWATAKKPLKQFYAAIFASTVPVIVTVRSKPKYDVDTEKGKLKVKAAGYNAPDAERGLIYTVDLALEMFKESEGKKPGTPLAPSDFYALVIKASGPKENNPLPIGKELRDPSWTAIQAMRLEGRGTKAIASAKTDLQVAQATVTTWHQMGTWLEGLGRDKDEAKSMLGEHFGTQLFPKHMEKYVAFLYDYYEANPIDWGEDPPGTDKEDTHQKLEIEKEPIAPVEVQATEPPPEPVEQSEGPDFRDTDIPF